MPKTVERSKKQSKAVHLVKKYVVGDDGKLVAIKVRDNSTPPQPQKEDTTLGMFADCSELMDTIVEDAMKDRETLPLRTDNE